MDDCECYVVGMEVCCVVLGDVYVDCVNVVQIELIVLFQDFIMCYVWGEIWMCFGLLCYMCSLLMIVMMVVFGCDGELCFYLCVVVNNGVICDEIQEMLLQIVIYCGVLVVNYVFYFVQMVFVEMDVEVVFKMQMQN